MDKQLKQRLLGAAVLVALAVIIIPELVKKPAGTGDIAISDIPLRPELAVATAGDVVPVTSPSDQAAEPTVTLSLRESSEEGVAAPEPYNNDGDAIELTYRNDPTVTADMASDLEAGAASFTAGAGPVAEQGLAAGSTAATQTPSQDSGTGSGVDNSAIRNQLGAETTQLITSSDADVAAPATVDPKTVANKPKPKAESIDLPKIELVSLKTRGLEQQPAKATAAATQAVVANTKVAADDPMWIVQAGSFAVAQNANLLRDRLQAKSFPVSLTPATVGGRKLYRVQVGPYPSKGEGERVKQRLREEVSVEGALTRYN